MKAYIGITDGDWYRFLRARPGLDEVNFFFIRATLLPATIAWDAFKEKNGAETFEEMRRRIER